MVHANLPVALKKLFESGQRQPTAGFAPTKSAQEKAPPDWAQASAPLAQGTTAPELLLVFRMDPVDFLLRVDAIGAPNASGVRRECSTDAVINSSACCMLHLPDGRT